jgi:hypothetical protein
MADEKIEHNDWPAVEVEGRVRRCGRIHEDGCHRPGELTEVGAKRIGSRRARRRKARLRRRGGLRGWVHRGGDPWHTGRRPRCGASVDHWRQRVLGIHCAEHNKVVSLLNGRDICHQIFGACGIAWQKSTLVQKIAFT